MKGLFATTLIAAVSAMDDKTQQFLEWALLHGKEYSSFQDFQHRLEQFIKFDEQVIAFNANSTTSTVGHNKFSDWTDEEWRAFNSYKPKERTTDVFLEAPEPVANDLPTEVNWVTAGGVNPVQDQGNCGSCWAFSAIASMEGFHFAKTKKLVKLSEQQCVDCDGDSMGCNGGYPDNCMWYVSDNGGIATEAQYPYIAQTDMCFADYGGAVNVTGVHPVKSYSQSALMTAISQGVTSVLVSAGSIAFRGYTGGVVTDPGCLGMLDHAVAAVGYGTDATTGLDYYLIRNSWGANWGDNGYIKLARVGDGYGICGVQEMNVYPSTN